VTQHPHTYPWHPAESVVPQPAPSAVRVNPRTFVVQADRLRPFLRDLAAGRESAVNLQDVGSVADLNPNDPRDTGYAGVLPNSHGRVPGSRLFRLYKQDGTFSRVVDQIAEDTWGEGWTLSTKSEAWSKQAYALDERLQVRASMELTDKWHLIGGTALLYLYLDAAGEPWREPKSVADVFHLKAVPRTRIREAKLGDDPHDERFDRVRAYVLNKNMGGQMTVHWQRVLEFRQYPDPDSEWEGISIGSRIHDDVRMKRNVEWAAVTAYGQRSAPLLVIQIKDGAQLGDADIDAMDEELGKLQAHVIQHVIAENFEVKAITGTAQLPDPMSWWLMAIRSLAVTTGIPAHIIAGMATGELASSQEDTRRWHARVSRRQENFGKPLLVEWYRRLSEWGLLPPVPDDLEVVWAPLGEPTAKEAMEIEELRARTMQTHRNAGTKPPAHLVDYTASEPPLSKLPPQVEYFGTPMELGAPGGVRGMPRRAPGRESAEEPLSPAEEVKVASVRRVEGAVRDRLHAAFMDFWRKWEPTLQAYVHASAESVQDGKPSVQLQADLGKALKDAAVQAYEEAIRLGALDAWAQAGADRAAFDAAMRQALEKRGVSYFRTVSRLEAADVARRVTQRLRDVVKDGLQAGQGFDLVRDRISNEWRDLAEYEASRIARTESMTAYNAGHQEAMEALGITELEFIAYPGSDYGDPFGPCLTRNGHVFPVGSEDDTPPLHPNCRCTTRPVRRGAP
jgi:SPP1 gp7 family putative phage head morphogenesis protein